MTIKKSGRVLPHPSAVFHVKTSPVLQETLKLPSARGQRKFFNENNTFSVGVDKTFTTFIGLCWPTEGVHSRKKRKMTTPPTLASICVIGWGGRKVVGAATTPLKPPTLDLAEATARG
jgi:hypothetical protein